MSLVANSLGFTRVPGAIYFPMSGGPVQVRCASPYGEDIRDPAKLDMSATFSANRAIFERLASVLYDTEAPSA